MEKKRDLRTIIRHFKLPTYFSLAKQKIDVFYSNIVVALGPKHELSSSVGSAILYSHEFPLSTNFKRAMNRWELVCYGVITLRFLVSTANVTPLLSSSPFECWITSGKYIHKRHFTYKLTRYCYAQGIVGHT